MEKKTSVAHVRVVGNYTIIDMYINGQLVSSISIDRTATKKPIKN